MELTSDYKNFFGHQEDYKVKTSKATPREVPDRISTNSAKTAVLCFRDEKDKIPFGSCLLCLAHVKDNIEEHVNRCIAKLVDEKNCSICLSQLDDKHLYSNSHAVQVEKMRVISRVHNSHIGVAKGGELVIDLKGANIIRQEYVYDLPKRIGRCKMPSPGGLAAFHLDAALTAAADNNSLSKNMAENSTIVQMLMQVSLAISYGIVPCTEAAKISYSLNGYSMIEMVGALNTRDPEKFPIEFATTKCWVHDIKEKTISFKTPLKSFNHLVDIMCTITGKDIKHLHPAEVANPPQNGAKKMSP